MINNFAEFKAAILDHTLIIYDVKEPRYVISMNWITDDNGYLWVEDYPKEYTIYERYTDLQTLWEIYELQQRIGRYCSD